jgi:hypothetical protein
MKINLIDYGMAYRLGNEIYINKCIKNYPKLYKAIIKHEKEHTDNYTLKDILIDLKGNHLSGVKKDYYLFFIRHPRSLIHFCPIFKLNNKWTYDPILSILYIIIIGILLLI